MRVAFALVLIGLAGLGWGSPTDRDHHMLCHSHDDLGWLKTVTEYYSDSVRRIFATVLDALEAPQPADAPKRKFHYSEVGFLKLFLNENADTKKAKIERITRLIKNGQWEWVNGGISQADEACPFYEDIISNFFHGQRYLKANFGTTSQTAWQIDPFGHSRTLFYLASKFGMSQGVFWRLDERQRRRLADQQALQLIWSLPEGRELLLHILPGYYPPESLSCDTDCDKNPFNATRFEQDCNAEDADFKSDVPFMLGGDFAWEQAASRFKFLEGAMQSYPRLKYSLFSEYADAFAKKVPRNKLTTYSGEFFVYDEGSDDNGDAWSGYFTTKPYLKYKIRRIGRVLRTLTNWLYGPQAIDVPNPGPDGSLEIHDISEEFGVLLHHDAITGTAKERVDADYLARANAIDIRANKLIQQESLWMCDYYDIEILKIQECEYSKVMRKTRHTIVLAFNSQPSVRDGLLQIMIPKLQENQKLDILPIFRIHPGKPDFEQICHFGLDYCMVYIQDVFPAVRVSVYSLRIILSDGPINGDLPSALRAEFVDAGVTSGVGLDWNDEQFARHGTKIAGETWLNFSDFKLRLDNKGVRMQTLDGKYTNDFSHVYMDAVDSGHYILKYNGKYEQKIYSTLAIYWAFQGKLVEGVNLMGQRVNIRILKQKSKPYFSFESRVRVDDFFKRGIDVILRIDTPGLGNTDSHFFTNGNGLFEQHRIVYKKFEDSVYPCTGWARVDSADSKRGVYVFNDRSQGVFGDKDTLGFYLQRSAVHEDHKGNEEVLKATENTVTRHIVFNYANADPLQVEDTVLEIANSIDEKLHLIILPIEESQLAQTMGKRFMSRLTTPVDAEIEFPSQIRLTVQVVDARRAILRFQNLSSRRTVAIDPATILKAWDPSFDFREVDFDYVVADPATERPLRAHYDLKPLEFLSVVKVRNVKEALVM